MDRDFLDTLDALLERLHARGVVEFRAFLDLAMGADPVLVRERLRRLGIALHVSTAGDPGAVWTPELHPVDFEWYFSSETARKISETLRLESSEVLLLGTPTVAGAAASMGVSSVLVDSSPWVTSRHAYASHSFIRHDLRFALRLGRRFGAVVLDPPWHLDDYFAWIHDALLHVEPKGRIIFPLFLHMHRPSARRERERILDRVRRLGPVTVVPNGVTYDCPLFEQRAFGAAGLALRSRWRRADLIVVYVEQVEQRWPRPEVHRSVWRTFLLGAQVVKLRIRKEPLRGPLLIHALPRSCGFRYDAISTRDKRRGDIDVWTSRNRAARVTRPDLLSEVLASIARGASIEASVAEFPSRESLASALGLLLERIEDSVD